MDESDVKTAEEAASPKSRQEAQKLGFAVEADAMSMCASTTAPSDVRRDRSKFWSKSSDWSALTLMRATRSGSVASRDALQDVEPEADELLLEAAALPSACSREEVTRPEVHGLGGFLIGGSPSMDKLLDFEVLETARGGFIHEDSSTASSSFGDLSFLDDSSETDEARTVDMSGCIAFDHLESKFGMATTPFEVAVRTISFDALPLLTHPISAEQGSYHISTSNQPSDSDSSALGFFADSVHSPGPTEETSPMLPPVAPPEWSAGPFHHIHLVSSARPTSATGSSGDAGVRGLEPMDGSSLSETSTDSLAGAVGSALRKFRRIGR